MRALLDTNAYTAFRRGHAAVIRHVRESEEVLLSPVVAGELLFGFRNQALHRPPTGARSRA